ncbi:MAG TPA: carbonic anhydrase, partial [Polyangiaceae bacterium]|nr:carbonic anhydrase [Polyangiaceae bacterium]
YFAGRQALFRQLAERGQRPETLFITCSDSRIDPTRLCSAEPGELFIVRNVGNIVPHVSLPGGTAAAIEYAVEALDVQNVVVCGHTHCGAIQAVLHPATMDRLPFVKRWLAQTDRVRTIVRERYQHLEGDALVTAAVAENVLVQLENLRAFSFIAERLERGALHLSGWVYSIETGTVFGFDPATSQFVDVTTPTAPPPPFAAP